jgi:anti-sigma regulatory factor (Ser/Thr protein kinase)
MHTRWVHPRRGRRRDATGSGQRGEPVATARRRTAPSHRRELVIAPDLRSVREAREVIRDTMSRWPSEGVERATVCGSELVANAVRHAVPPIVLTVVEGADRVVIAVQDGSRKPPLPRWAESTDQSGRGTMLVDRMADLWGVEFLPTGKRVWCMITRPPPDRVGLES